MVHAAAVIDLPVRSFYPKSRPHVRTGINGRSCQSVGHATIERQQQQARSTGLSDFINQNRLKMSVQHRKTIGYYDQCSLL